MRHYNIPVFIPHLGCPFQCIFCNQNKIASQEQVPDARDVAHIIEEHLLTIPSTGVEIEVAFFGGNFTAIDRVLQEEYLGVVYPYLHNEQIQGVRLSTRPDCIDEDELNFLAKWGVKTIELGVQSLSDEVLKASCRGYVAEDVFKAAHLIRKHKFQLGAQLMIGLPGDSYDLDMETTEKLIAMQVDMVRIYPTLVVAGTNLETRYKRGDYQPLSLEEAVRISKDILLRLQKAGVDVIRTGLYPSEDLRSEGTVIAGPFHPSFGELVEQEIFKEQALKALKGFFAICGFQEEISLFVHKKDISKMIGHKRSNIAFLQEYFHLRKLEVRPGETLERDTVGVGRHHSTQPRLVISRLEILRDA